MTKEKNVQLYHNGLYIASYNTYYEALDGMEECQFLDHESNCDDDCEFDDYCPYKETVYRIRDSRIS